MKTKQRKTYDSGMIRDFIDHLKWEVRTCHFENVSAPNALNPELIDQLAKYQRKRGCFGLLTGQLTREKPDADALAEWKARRAGEMQTYIDALELLEPLFQEAVFCAANRQFINIAHKADFSCCKRSESPRPWTQPA